MERDFQGNVADEVREAVRALKVLLHQAGTSPSELQQILLGEIWEGSIFIILEAPDSVFEKISHFGWHPRTSGLF